MSDEMKKAVAELRAAASTPGPTTATVRLEPLLAEYGAMSQLARTTGLDKALVSRHRKGAARPTLFDAAIYETATDGFVRSNDWLTPAEREFLEALHPGGESMTEVRHALDLCRSLRERMVKIKSAHREGSQALRIQSAEQALSTVESVLEKLIQT